MYTPLQYMEQLETMIKVQGMPSLNGLMNRKNIEWFEHIIKMDRPAYQRLSSVGWSCCKAGINVPDDIKDTAERLQTDYGNKIGLKAAASEDFYLLLLLNIIHHDWSRNKRVYNVEEGMLHDLCNMTVPKAVNSDIITKLPTKCFYMDWSGDAEYCPEAQGVFVLYDTLNGSATYSLVTLVRHKKLIPIITTLELKDFEGAEVSPNISAFSDGKDLTLEDGSNVFYNEQMVVRLFYNFCLYLSAMNSDVTYTERTREIYKPAKQGCKPKNRMCEIEEFGVGFRYTTVKPKTVVRYREPAAATEPKEKRAYSSNYRSAHWQHFWINDPDNLGQKLRVVKWVEGTFVRGNRSTDVVNVHEVKPLTK